MIKGTWQNEPHLTSFYFPGFFFLSVYSWTLHAIHCLHVASWGSLALGKPTEIPYSTRRQVFRSGTIPLLLFLPNLSNLANDRGGPAFRKILFFRMLHLLSLLISHLLFRQRLVFRASDGGVGSFFFQTFSNILLPKGPLLVASISRLRLPQIHYPSISDYRTWRG